MSIEKHKTPQWADDRVANLGGNNRYGKPNFRIVWGGSRTHLVGGMFKKVVYVEAEESIPIIGQPSRKIGVVTQIAEMRRLPKYFAHRWWLEKWCGPEVYGSPESWYEETWNEEAKLHSMGPYPSEGDYESVAFLGQCSHMKVGDTEWCGPCRVTFGEYVSLEDGIHIFEWHIWALEQSKGITESQERLALFDREARKRQASRKRTADMVSNAMRPAMALQSTSWQPGTGGKCSVPEAKFNPTLQVPRSSGLKQV